MKRLATPEITNVPASTPTSKRSKVRTSARASLVALLLLPLVLLIASLVHIAPAVAAVGYGQLPLTFGSSVLEKPTDITVDQANGNVYVTSSGSNTVDLFGPEGGSPLDGFMTPITGPAGLPFHFGGEPSAVAIDESGGTSNGDLYVSDAENNVVDKFKPTGLGEYTYVCRFVGYGQGCEENPTVSPTWHEPDGVAVDSHGNVYVASFGPGTGAVYEFDSEGQDVREFSGGDIGTRGPEAKPVGVAVDAKDNVYVNNYRNSIVKIDASGHESLLDEGGSRGVAVDAHGDVFVDDGSAIVEYDESAELVDRFGEGSASESEGIAVDDSTGDVYVSDKSTNEVLVFGQVVVPTVMTGGASGAKGTMAKVAGSVNPEGIEAQYFVEYGQCNENRLVKCPQSPYTDMTAETELPEPSGTNPEAVEAELTGLSPNTAYRYRLVGKNVNGSARGKEGTFTTGPAVAGVSTTFATSIQPAGATLNGMLDPEGAPAHYYFEYASEATYNEALENGASNPYSASTEAEPGERSGSGEEVAGTPVTGLEFGTTYHYRIVTHNGYGETVGEDHTMTTLPALPIVDDLRPSFATGVGYHEAELRGTVNPGRGMTSYTFQYGTSSAYEFSTPPVYTQANDEDDQVEQAISGLQPGTLYHYELLATNATGMATSEEGEFTTLAEGAEPQPEGGTGGSQPAAGSPLTQPSTPGLLPFTPVAFPTETGVIGPPPKKLTNAQKLTNALKTCRKHHKGSSPRARKQRRSCEKQARKRY
jgi:sugar lactone lactonase YvrE